MQTAGYSLCFGMAGKTIVTINPKSISTHQGESALLMLESALTEEVEAGEIDTFADALKNTKVSNIDFYQVDQGNQQVLRAEIRKPPAELLAPKLVKTIFTSLFASDSQQEKMSKLQILLQETLKAAGGSSKKR